ncbi:tRNA glutamyl-Q(34) synthetase GluQRS [Novosphingobium sp. G106]|uniref:tRNA glutamyl-Q(34) synthetase GluQRS n=1 Tax=Novosphingobium sp. G106 TaxID=2849500 RepID=UPI001C2D09E6|nr:tRNA glutamyl-Q(34) synthetase GluQRS [Novosphingobium sp. G106]MBV1689609.1 tRNA glutamyl-Q(34) synthetase GluQRS [Novosphingobium sp. G106]
MRDNQHAGRFAVKCLGQAKSTAANPELTLTRPRLVTRPITRFAPSPNGSLHLGHAYAALVAHDLARARGGAFLLRIEDIDGTRSRPELVEEEFADLTWLGLEWDGEAVFQSARLDSYAAAGERLKAMGLLYPCQCTRAEIAAAAGTMGPDGPVYPGTCRHRDLDPAGAAWRIDMAQATALAGPLEWIDERGGPQRAAPELFGDVVLLRRDAPASYHLAATLDDAADGVTLVTRGMDLFAASHVHRLLQALLALPVPTWHHHGLLVEPDGRKLAKRRGSASLADRRRAGEDGPALAADLRAHRFPAGISLDEGLHKPS